MIRVLLVDDHPAVREGLADILSRDPDIRVVGEASSAPDALRRLTRCDPHVVSLEARLPGTSGLDLCARLARTRPELRVLALASGGDRAALDAFGAGAHGFFQKGSSPGLLREAIRAVAMGGTFIDPSVAEALVDMARRNPPSRS